MKIQLIRHATLRLQYAGKELLIDPMFSEAGANPPIANSENELRNPLVPLPAEAINLLTPDAVLVTHLHQDHWDAAAAHALPKAIPVFCQPGDETKIETSGFHFVTSVTNTVTFNGITLIRTTGRHGTGEIGIRMGQVSGFILKADGEPTLYITGDTIWCDDVKQALDAYVPEITVVNAGGARFLTGDPITMDAGDVGSACRYAPYTKVIAVHMESINHCLVTRADLQASMESEGLNKQVLIPLDGEWVQL